MGKYIRNCRGGGTTEAAASAVVVAGVRTRSRSAAAAAPAPVPKRARKQAAPSCAEAGAVDMGRDEHGDDGGEAGKGCCYLQLRSRTLFMVAAEVDASPREEPVPVAALEEVEEEASPVVSVAGVSRCSSTASSSSSSVDVATTLRTRNGCTAEAREDCGEESSVSDSRSGPQPQEWREATPSSRALGDDDLSDQESSKASDDDPNKQHHRRQPSSAAATTTAVRSCRATRTTMPRPEEIEEFFAAAEKAEAERFAERYNFDVVRGLPLDAGGRFEWTPSPWRQRCSTAQRSPWTVAASGGFD